MIGQALTLLAVSTQSVGKVLYGTFLAGTSTALFLLVSFTLAALVFLCAARFRFPAGGGRLILMANIWTAAGFIGLFFALKYLPPAVFAAIEIGVSLVVAVALSAAASKTWPTRAQILTCAGLIAGCTLLAWNEILRAFATPSALMVWLAVAACVAAGIASTLGATACKALAARGWSSVTVLAHRSYLIIALAAGWLVLDPSLAVVPAEVGIEAMVAVAAIVVLAPALLFQIALRRADVVSVMLCAGVQPVLSFAAALPSPAYGWSWLAFIGSVAVSLCVVWDVLASHAATRRPRPAKVAAIVRAAAWPPVDRQGRAVPSRRRPRYRNPSLSVPWRARHALALAGSVPSGSLRRWRTW